MIGHLGSRVSALLDGQLSPEETERAWAHVHTCHSCRDQVEREGWVKTRLSVLSRSDAAPEHLKGSLLGALSGMPCGSGPTAGPHAAALGAPSDPMSGSPGSRRALGLAAFGGPAVGAAVLGVLALGAAPADAPTLDRRAPVTSVTQPTVAPGGWATRRADLP